MLQNPERKETMPSEHAGFYFFDQNLKVLAPAGDILAQAVLTFPEHSEVDMKAKIYTQSLFQYLNLTARFPLLLLSRGLLLCYDLASTDFSHNFFRDLGRENSVE